MKRQLINAVYSINYRDAIGTCCVSATLRRWRSDAASVVIVALICDSQQWRQRRCHIILRASPPSHAAAPTSGMLGIPDPDLHHLQHGRLQFGVHDNVQWQTKETPSHHLHGGTTGETGGHFPSDTLPRRATQGTVGPHRRPQGGTS